MKKMHRSVRLKNFTTALYDGKKRILNLQKKNSDVY